MTWEEIKRTVEKQGVKDSDEIAWIDVHPFGTDDVEVKRDEDGTIQINDRF
jgi:hypothetical protein